MSAMTIQATDQKLVMGRILHMSHETGFSAQVTSIAVDEHAGKHQMLK